MLGVGGQPMPIWSHDFHDLYEQCKLEQHAGEDPEGTGQVHTKHSCHSKRERPLGYFIKHMVSKKIELVFVCN